MNTENGRGRQGARWQMMVGPWSIRVTKVSEMQPPPAGADGLKREDLGKVVEGAQARVLGWDRVSW